MPDSIDIKRFLEEERQKLLEDKMRLQCRGFDSIETKTKTNDLETVRTFSKGPNANSVNSKVILNDCTPDNDRPSPPSTGFLNEASETSLSEDKSTLSKSPGNTASAGSRNNLTDAQQDMSTISRYTTTSNLTYRRSQSEGVSCISSLGAEYEQRKRELLLARNRDYKEYLAKQKLLEQKSKSKRQNNYNNDWDSYSSSGYTNATATQTSTRNKFDTPIQTVDTGERQKKCTIAVQTEPLRSLAVNERGRNRPAYRNRSLDLISYGGGDSHDWEDDIATSERVMSISKPKHLDDQSVIRHPKALSKRKMIEQLRSSYYPSFGDSFETPEERKIRLAKEEARKREIYQMELSEQIREKRLEMEAKQRKEMEEEEALARRLEAQIQNMQMERDLELLSQENRKEKMRKNSIRFNERKKQLQLEVEQEKERLRQARKSCPHNTQPSTSVALTRSKSPPIPALKNRQQLPFSTNIDEHSIFANSHKTTDKLTEQIRKLNLDSNTKDFAVYKNYETNSTFSDDYATKVASWDISSTFRDDRNEHVRRSVSEDSVGRSASCHSGTEFTENKDQNYSEMSIHIDEIHDDNCLTKVLSDEKFATNSILTQLGAIRRQLQMTQIELDEQQSKS